ncbi:carbamate kinase [candidate division WOR-3 bacterium]|nr:carbamate kinase [candidate division WOR-3 bacterium]
MNPIIALAIGGNSLVRSKGAVSYSDQMATLVPTCRPIADLLASGNRLLVTHGNGPQVGFILIRSHLARSRLPEIPLDVCTAQTQAETGYMIQQALGNELARRSVSIPVATIVTRTVVAADDPAFEHPSKPVGPFYTKAEAARLQRELNWSMREDSGRGFRRLVPSPRPTAVVELPQVAALLESGAVVIAAGGGGIPVLQQDGGFAGVAAVIDKDLASSLLAAQLGARSLVISTAVDCVYLDYGLPGQRPLGRIRAAELRGYLDAGQFPPGSMGPKVEAALDFLDRGGKEVIITDPDHLAEALRHEAGTRILP